MKITVVPPAPPDPTYLLELTKEQLVALGVLSFRHEVRGVEDSYGHTFFSSLPDDISLVVRHAEARIPKETNRSITRFTVDWTESP